jgi:hypothetical protein
VKRELEYGNFRGTIISDMYCTILKVSQLLVERSTESPVDGHRWIYCRLPTSTTVQSSSHPFSTDPSIHRHIHNHSDIRIKAHKRERVIAIYVVPPSISSGGGRNRKLPLDFISSKVEFLEKRNQSWGSSGCRPVL